LLIPLFSIERAYYTGLKKRNFYIFISLAYMTICILFLHNSYEIAGIDKNIFMVPFIPLVIYYSINFSIISVLLLILCFFSGSRLPIYIFIISFVLNRTFRSYKINLFNYIIAISAGIFIPTFILYMMPSFVNEISSTRGLFDLLDASNIERSTALINALSYLDDNQSIMLFGGGWEDYSTLVSTRVHSDFFQLIIKHGIIFTLLFVIAISNAYHRLKLPILVVFLLSLFSSILGGIAWFGGLFWLFPLILLFNNANNK
jgi:hypothetical protein